MAKVVSITQIMAPDEQADADSKSGSSVVVYRVEVDDKATHSSFALTANDGHGMRIPAVGEVLQGGGIVKSLSSRRQTESPFHFLVRVTLSTADQSNTGGGSKFLTDLYGDGIPFSRTLYKDLTLHPIVNAVGDTFDPPLQTVEFDEEFGMAFRTANLDVDAISALRGKCNAQPVTLDLTLKTLSYSRVFPKETLKLEKFRYGITLGQDSLPTWRVELTFVYREDGWAKTKVLNQGFRYIDGASNRVNVLDDWNQPLRTPVMLDINGQKLAPGANAVELEFVTVGTADFTPLFGGFVE